ncbi:hypothetical protein A2U01_0099894, partial [Trifolium medium]|nr:hypothetical protein [Trifolium medium]
MAPVVKGGVEMEMG